MLEGQAGHFGVPLEVAAHVDRVDEEDAGGTSIGFDKLILVVFLQVN